MLDRRFHRKQEQTRTLGPRDYILPEGWVVAHSKRENRDYYFNGMNNSTQWHPPPGSQPRQQRN